MGRGSRENFQVDTTREIRQLARSIAARRGMALKEFIHQALAKEDPELARLIAEQLGLVVERR
jgi:cytidylate kinase